MPYYLSKVTKAVFTRDAACSVISSFSVAAKKPIAAQITLRGIFNRSVAKILNVGYLPLKSLEQVFPRLPRNKTQLIKLLGLLVVRRILEKNLQSLEAAQSELFAMCQYHAFVTTIDDSVLNIVAADKRPRRHVTNGRDRHP